MHFSTFFAAAMLLLTPAAFAGPVGDAAKKGDTVEVQRLLEAGADVNEADALASPLHWAAMNGHLDALKLLVKNDAQLDAQSNMLGTPLHAAARFGRADAITELVQAGADPDVRDRDAFTPLMRAVIENRIPAVAALLKSGADVNIVAFATGGDPARGPTIALHLAARLKHMEVAELLRSAGAGPIPPEVPDKVLSNGNAERGLEVAKVRCVSCHALPEASVPLSDEIAGPPLIGVMGRPVADLEFDYSEALKSHGGTWTPDRFYQFVFRPMLTVPGTKMFWSPELSPEQVADLAAYFLSSSK